jgi:hypothetical protein
MTAGRAFRLGLAASCVVAAVAGGVDAPPGPIAPAEVRVLSLPGHPTTLTIQATPDAHVVDRTPGAHPSAGQGAASTGETFSDEITFVVSGSTRARAATIDVSDALVSTVRLFPDPAGTQVVVFVRQPVTYTIGAPSAGGAIALTLRPRAVPKPPAHPGGGAGRLAFGARPSEGGEEQVAIDAAELSYDQQANVLVARGGVMITRGDTTLRADEVRYDRTTSVAEAHGHVIVIDPEANIEGDAARIDLDDETGWIDDAHGDMKQSPYRLTADHVEKKGGPCYTAINGIFTTCRCGGVERPSWSVKSGHTDVELSGVGVAKDATFRIADTPVLYMPYLLFPANTDRQSGLLMPRIGYSNKRGFVYEQPFYWAIDKSSDATIAVDLETAARIGLITEYRYALSRTAFGVITGGYFNESIGGAKETIQPLAPGTLDVPENRWIVAARNRAKPWDNGSLFLDILRVSDDQFFREIRAFSSTVRGDIQVRSTRFTRTQLGLVQTWEGGGAEVEALSYQDLIDPQSLALNEVPRIAAEHGIPLLNGLAVARMAGETVDFQRRSGFDGLRADFAPELFVPMHLGNVLSGSLRGQLRETAYHLTANQQVGVFVPNNPGLTTTFESGNQFAPNISTDHTREIGEMQGRLGTEFGRVYDFPYFGLARLRHTIEPEVQYLFVPHVETNYGQTSNVVRPTDGERGTFFSEGYLFDEVDAIRKRNFWSYGFTTRLIGRGAAPAPTPAPEPSEAAPAEAATPSEAFDDEDADQESDDIEDIDPDVVPQGLPAAAIPPVGRPAKNPKPAAAVPSVLATRELLRWSILHGYDISRTLTGDSHFSNIDSQLRFAPIDWAGASYTTSIDVNQGKALAHTVGLVVRDPTWAAPTDRPSFQVPTTIGIAYRFVAADAADVTTSGLEQRLFRNSSNVEELDGSLYLRLTDYVGVGFLARYDLASTLAPSSSNPNKLVTLGPRFLERDGFVRLISKCNCWIVEAGVSNRSDTNDTTIRMQFTLYGLGSFGQSPATRGYSALTGLQSLGFRRPRATGGYFE